MFCSSKSLFSLQRNFRWIHIKAKYIFHPLSFSFKLLFDRYFSRPWCLQVCNVFVSSSSHLSLPTWCLYSLMILSLDTIRLVKQKSIMKDYWSYTNIERYGVIRKMFDKSYCTRSFVFTQNFTLGHLENAQLSSYSHKIYLALQVSTKQFCETYMFSYSCPIFPFAIPSMYILPSLGFLHMSFLYRQKGMAYNRLVTAVWSHGPGDWF